MVWSEIRKVYPNQWLVIEALEAYTTPKKQRELDRIAVIEQCADGSNALEVKSVTSFTNSTPCASFILYT